jgi:hypothetical protein
MTDQECSGVWLSNVPLDINEGAATVRRLCPGAAALLVTRGGLRF